MRGELSVNLILLWEFYPTAGESGTWPFASNHCITGTQTNGRRKNRVIPLHNNHRGPIKSITAFTANISSHRPSNLLSYNPRVLKVKFPMRAAIYCENDSYWNVSSGFSVRGGWIWEQYCVRSQELMCSRIESGSHLGGGFRNNEFDWERRYC